ncbi:hypothetical protein K502DRAFT_323025 [Neoconidiobolus thromboides FSU 785]|nr:hypothetical protein K502DRAFT_323025 [Neoconidiobolus thromboides FSU 785]
MKIVREDIVTRYGTTDDRATLFKKDGPERAVAGDMMVVEFYRNAKKQVTTSFAGICIAIHRSGPTTSVTLRNMVLKVGVEQKFRVFSPMVKSIKVLRSSQGFRRAKLYYLRDQPRKARLGVLKKLGY